jgi:hypothetical protein
MVLVPPPSSDSSPASEAARIPLTDEAVLALLRQHFAGIDSLYLCPSIPGKKELAARGVHARHLPSHERVLALFDDTIFGSGDEGFVVTAQRVCWKNIGGRPSMIEWQHIDPDRMYADRRKLVLGAGAIEVTGDDESVIEACEQAFHVLAFSARLSHRHHAANAQSGIVAPPPAARISDHPTFRPSRAPSHAAPLESEVVPRSDRNPGIANIADGTPPSSRRGLHRVVGNR